MPHFRGTEGPIVNSVLHSGDIVTGTSTQVTWKGSKAAIDAIAADLNEQGIKFDQSRVAGPVYSITAYYPYEFGVNPEPQIIWEIRQEMLHKTIWSHPEVALEANSFIPTDTTKNGPAYYKKGIEDAIQKGESLPDEYLSYPFALKVMNELTAGTEAFETEYIVLSRSQLIAKEFAPQTELNATLFIIKTDDLISVFDVPQDIANILPDDPPETDTQHTWGWRMRPGHRRFVGQRVEIYDEWVFNCWSNFIYNIYEP